MKKLIATLLALVIVMSFAGCAQAPADKGGETTKATDPVTEPSADPTEPSGNDETPEAPAVMTYEEYMAAEKNAKVCIETYVQACRGWWNDTICVYAQGPDGGYFMYDMACSEADAAKLVPGTKIRVVGDKAIYDGEVEIINGTFEFVDDAEPFIAEAMDATELLGTEELETHMNKFASFTGLTIEAITYKNDAPGDDIYVSVKKDDQVFDFCVEVYLTGTESDVYKTVGELKAGDVVNVEGFLYWYNGVNTHITAIEKAQ